LSTIKIIIADHQYLIRMGLRHILGRNKGMEVVDEVANSSELLQAVKKHSPQIVLMDYNDSNSFSVSDIYHINQKFPGCRFVIITADENRESINKALSFGVNGFLTKTCDRDEIKKAITATAKGEKFFCNKILDIILAKHLGQDVEEDCEPTELTVREVEIVKLVSDGHSSKKIAELLNLSLHTVQTHRRNVMRKLKISSVSELVMYAVNTGLTTVAAK